MRGKNANVDNEECAQRNDNISGLLENSRQELITGGKIRTGRKPGALLKKRPHDS